MEDERSYVRSTKAPGEMAAEEMRTWTTLVWEGFTGQVAGEEEEPATGENGGSMEDSND